MYPGISPIRSPRRTVTCQSCGESSYWPASLLRFEDPGRRHGRFIRICGRCYPHVFLLERPDICAAVRRSGVAVRRAWYKHIGPVLFDEVRAEGAAEPMDLRELVAWLYVEHRRQVGVMETLVREFGEDVGYSGLDAVCTMLAACEGRLAR